MSIDIPDAVRRAADEAQQDWWASLANSNGNEPELYEAILEAVYPAITADLRAQWAEDAMVEAGEEIMTNGDTARYRELYRTSLWIERHDALAGTEGDDEIQ